MKHKGVYTIFIDYSTNKYRSLGKKQLGKYRFIWSTVPTYKQQEHVVHSVQCTIYIHTKKPKRESTTTVSSQFRKMWLLKIVCLKMCSYDQCFNSWIAITQHFLIFFNLNFHESLSLNQWFKIWTCGWQFSDLGKMN